MIVNVSRRTAGDRRPARRTAALRAGLLGTSALIAFGLAATPAAADLGPGNDTYVYVGGDLGGVIDGGAGTDTFVSDLAGGSATLSLNDMTGFEIYQHLSGHLTLTGSRTAGPGWALVPAASITLDGELNTSSIGFQMNGNGAPATISILEGAQLTGFYGATYNTGAANVFNNAGTVQGTMGGVQSNGALTVTNSGQIDAGDSGALVFGFGRSTVINSGSLTGGSSADTGYGVTSLHGGGANITNTGVITGGAGGIRGEGTTLGGFLYNQTLTVANSAGGVITGAVGILAGPDAALDLVNAGRVESGLGAAILTAGAGEALIRNQAGGEIMGVNGIVNAGDALTLINEAGAVIVGVEYGVQVNGADGSITNTGVLRSTGGQAIALDGGDGRILNHEGGVIAGAANGIVSQSAGNTLANEGVIAGRLNGVVGADHAMEVTNAGLILSGDVTDATTTLDEANRIGMSGVRLEAGGSVTNLAGGVIAGVGSGVAIIGGGTVANAGLIDASAGIGVEMMGGGAITNEAGGVISGDSALLLTGSGDYLVDLHEGSTTRGSILALSVGDRSVFIAGLLDGVYFADGSTGADHLTLAATGAMSGAVLGAGNDTFVWQGGLLSGLLFGGAGTDAFISDLDGGSGTFDLGSLTGFESHTHQNGQLTLTGTQTGGLGWGLGAGGTLILDGALDGITGDGVFSTVAADVTITADGAILADGAALQLSAADNAVVNAGSLFSNGSSAVQLGGGTITNTGGIYGLFGAGMIAYGPIELENLAGGEIVGRHFAVWLNDGGTIINAAGAEMLSDGADATAVILAADGLTLINGGRIANTGGSTANRHYGVNVLDGVAEINNLATGEITGHWAGVHTTGTLSLTNAGLINGGRFAGIEGGGTVINLEGGRIQALSFDGHGLLSNGGGLAVENQGEIEGGIFGVFNRSTDELEVVNAGQITGQSGGIVSDGAASVTNLADGGVFASGGIAIQLAGAGSTLDNAGLITGLAGGVSGATDLSVFNSGEIIALNAYGIYGAGDLTVTNAEGGAVTGGAGVRAQGGLVLDNAGLISGGSWDRTVVALSSATITNAATGEIRATGNNAIYVTGDDAIVQNAGLIASTGPNSALYMRGLNASVTNLAGGEILAESTGRGVWFDYAATLQNAGRITGVTAVELRGDGVVDNLAGGVLEGANYGIFGNAGTTVSLVNDGLITGSSHALIVNRGAAHVTNGENGVMRGGVFNAVYSWASGTTVTNAGLMEGGNAAIYLDGGDAVIENTGVVRIIGTTAPSTISGIFVLGGNVSITNSGVIESTLSGGRGIYLAGGAGTIVNQAGGVIAGLDASAIILEGADYVLDLQAGSRVEGDINATLSDGVDLTLAGELNGGFFGGAGDDRLTLVGGAIYSGPLDGGDGIDALVLTGATDGMFDVGSVFGVESRTKTGAGTWTLTGTDALDLDWMVEDGVLAVTGGQAIFDSARVELAADGALRVMGSEAFDVLVGDGEVLIDEDQMLLLGVHGGDSLLDGHLAGAGSLLQSGSGTLTLGGTNALTGDTRVNAGVLRLGASGALSAASRLIVQNGAVLDLQGFDGAASLAYLSGTVNGTGTLTAELYGLTGATINADLGAGQLVHNSGLSMLNGASAASQVYVASDALRIGGDERLADGAALTVASGATFELDGHAETIGRLWGEGEVNLGGGSLSLANATSTFGGTLSGLGAVNHAAGLFTLLGENHTAAMIRTTGGQLRFVGATSGDVHVNGGTLTGQADIGGTLMVDAGGVLSPGLDGVGVFTAGGLTLNGGVLAVDLLGVSGGNLSDLVLVNGVANLTGGTLDTNFVGPVGDFDFTTTYVILAAHRLVGQFANGGEFTADPTKEGLYWRVRYDLLDDAAVIELRQLVDFVPGDAGTNNQNAVGRALSRGQIEADDGWAGVLRLLAGLDAAERLDALDALGGEALANTSTSALTAADRFVEAVRQGALGPAAGAGGDDALDFGARLQLSRDGFNGRLAGQDSLNLGLLEAAAGAHRGAWLTTYASDSRLDGRPGQADLSTNITGLAGGFGLQSGHLAIGVAAGVSDLKGEVDARASTYDVSMNHGALYARYDDSVWVADATVMRFDGQMDSMRAVTVGAGAVAAAGAADLRGQAISLGFARRFQLGEALQLAVGAVGTASSVDIDAYVETGAGGLSLEVAEQSREWRTLAVDARLARNYVLAGGALRTFAGLGAIRTSGDRDAMAQMRFSGAATGFGGFTVEGAQTPPLAGLVDLGAEYTGDGGWTASIGYRGVFADRLEEHRLGARVGVRW